MLNAVVLTFCRIAIAVVFALSAGGKALNVSAFRSSIEDFRLIPMRWSKATAWTFLASEVAAALSMVIGGDTLLAGFVLAAGLLVVFSVALLVALRRDGRISCNCFGRAERRISRYDVARNALLVACSLAGIWALNGSPAVLPRLELILIVLMTLCFVAFVVNLRDVVETLRRPYRVG